MATAQRYIDRMLTLTTDRSFYENDWRRVNRYALVSNKFFLNGEGGINASIGTPKAVQSNRNTLYDSTAVYALDRLSAALVSLLVPSGTKWHSLSIAGFDIEENDEIQRWLENVVNLQFDIRYTPSSGWDSAVAKAIKSMVAFSLGVVFVEEGDDQTVIDYRFIPLNEIFLGVNSKGQYDKTYKFFYLTAEQAVGKFNKEGDNLNPKIVADAESSTNRSNIYEFIHAVELRDVGKDFNKDSESSRWTNDYIDVEHNEIVRTGGFFSFPYIVFWWEKDTEESYGTSPMIKALDEIAGLNSMGKDELIMYSQQAAPPMITAAKGNARRLDFRPNAVNSNVQWQNGRPTIQPLLDGRNINFAEAVKADRTSKVERSMYLNLFQVLTQTGGTQTATEALIKDREKAEMFAPLGNNIRQSLSALNDRELDILQRKGLFDGEFEKFTPPDSIPDDADVQPIFVSPLDKARDLGEVEGTMKLYQAAQQIIAVTQDPAPLDYLDPEKDIKRMSDIFGHPANSLRTDSEVEAIRAEKEQAQQMQQSAQLAPPMAKSALDGANALKVMQEVGAGQ